MASCCCGTTATVTSAEIVPATCLCGHGGTVSVQLQSGEWVVLGTLTPWEFTPTPAMPTADQVYAILGAIDAAAAKREEDGEARAAAGWTREHFAGLGRRHGERCRLALDRFPRRRPEAPWRARSDCLPQRLRGR